MLIFSQMTRMLDIVQDYLGFRGQSTLSQSSCYSPLPNSIMPSMSNFSKSQVSLLDMSSNSKTTLSSCFCFSQCVMCCLCCRLLVRTIGRVCPRGGEVSCCPQLHQRRGDVYLPPQHKSWRSRVESGRSGYHRLFGFGL